MAKIAILFAILLLAAAPFPAAAAKRGLPEGVVPECLGVNIHFVGDDEKQVKMIADAGFRLVRMDFLWEWVETEKGKYDFTKYDGLMAALDRHGVRPLFIIDYGNPLYPGSNIPSTDETRKALAAFAGAAAAHFRDRGVIWEIWNEPNYKAFGTEVYARMALAASKAIHDADPTATVVGPALATFDFGFLDGILKAGALEGIQGITVHPYRGAGSPPETAAKDYASARSMIARYAPAGKTVPLLSGEWGYTMTEMNAEQQARYLVRMFLSNLASGVNFSIWYDWSDDGTDPNYGEHHFGTVYIDLTPKPAYRAMRVLSRELEGYRFAGRVGTENPDDHVLIFRKGVDRKLAAWTIGKDHEISLPVDVSSCNMRDMYDKRRSGIVADRRLRLDLSQDVTYVEVLGKSRRLALEEAWQVSSEVDESVGAGSLPVRYRLTNPLDQALRAVVSVRDPSQSTPEVSRRIVLAPGETREGVVSLDATWDGSSTPVTIVELTVEGVADPIRRFVQLDTAQLLTVTAAPPLNEVVPVYIHNPSGQPFAGSVKVHGGGAASGAVTMPVKLAKGQTFAEVDCRIVPSDPGNCVLSVALLNAKGKAIYSPQPFIYKLVAPFDDAAKVGVAHDGNGGVPVSTKQTTAAPPEPLAGVASCTKIDYSFGNGWRYVKFNFGQPAAIENEPIYAGAWVYGNESGDMLAIRLRDSTNQCLQPGSVKLDFRGWRFVTWSLAASRMGHWEGANDGAIHWPMRWDSQLMLDSNQREHSGAIYVGPMWIAY